MDAVLNNNTVSPKVLSIAKQQRVVDRVFKYTIQFFALSVLLTLLGIIASLVFNAAPALSKFGFGFFTTVEWDVVNGEFGGLIAIYGTIITSVIALVIAVPLSFGIAVFLLKCAHQFCADLLEPPLRSWRQYPPSFMECLVYLSLLRYLRSIYNQP
jgi:phosphate transport system permease protein